MTLRSSTFPKRSVQGARPSWAVMALWAVSMGYASITWAGDAPAEHGNGEEETFSLDTGEGAGADPSRRTGGAAPIWNSITENLRLNKDLISRVETTHQRGEAAELNAIGLDLYTVISGRNGDLGTLLLQPYVVRRDNALPIPPWVEDDDDWEFEWHDFYFNLTRWGKGRTNFKIGHFDVPFGLEPLVDTHFTLYQLIPMQNLGMMKDWGMSLNGALPQLDYEVSLSRGSGLEYVDVGENFAIAGRIGTPSDQNFVLGASVLYGQVMDPHRIHRWRSGLGPMSGGGHPMARGSRFEEKLAGENVIQRLRAGFDATRIIQQFTLRGEVSAGRDFNQGVFNSLIEFDWTTADDKLTAYLQGIYLGQSKVAGWDEDVFARLGAVWKINDHCSVSAQYRQDFSTFGPHPVDATFSLQMRLYF